MIYLIDYENGNTMGLGGIKKLKETDTVGIFFGVVNTSLPIEAVFECKCSPAKMFIRRAKKSANNYVDFQICAHLGTLIGSVPPTANASAKEFAIISKDNGYIAVVDYFATYRPDITIIVSSSIAQAKISLKAKKGENIMSKPVAPAAETKPPIAPAAETKPPIVTATETKPPIAPATETKPPIVLTADKTDLPDVKTVKRTKPKIIDFEDILEENKKSDDKPILPEVKSIQVDKEELKNILPEVNTVKPPKTTKTKIPKIDKEEVENIPPEIQVQYMTLKERIIQTFKEKNLNPTDEQFEKMWDIFVGSEDKQKLYVEIVHLHGMKTGIPYYKVFREVWLELKSA
ncbi:MAG: hypothetical protein LBL93_03340 [Ruminococcus sp.]|jgi:hypothetical protein|nr:hypothetical protein [Ruminococcus sp.]